MRISPYIIMSGYAILVEMSVAGNFRKQELQDMKKILMASALAVVASASNADNTHSVKTTMSAYVSQGVTAAATTNLIFPDIVKPAANEDSYTVVVSPSAGTVKYTGRAAPGGGVDGAAYQNETGSSTEVGQRDFQVGVIDVTGEPGYTFRLTIGPENLTDLPIGLGYVSLIDNGETDSNTSAALVLGGEGTASVKYGGTLTVDGSFIITTGAETEISLLATVDYM